MRRFIRAVLETVRDPFATRPSASEKNAWNLADVLKATASAVIAFVGMIPLTELLQLAAGHPEHFGEYGPLVTAGCIFALQIIRTFRQGKPDDDDEDGGQDHPVQPPPHVVGPWA